MHLKLPVRVLLEHDQRSKHSTQVLKKVRLGAIKVGKMLPRQSSSSSLDRVGGKVRPQCVPRRLGNMKGWHCENVAPKRFQCCYDLGM
jgi:hypothetical protein